MGLLPGSSAEGGLRLADGVCQAIRKSLCYDSKVALACEFLGLRSGAVFELPARAKASMKSANHFWVGKGECLCLLALVVDAHARGLGMANMLDRSRSWPTRAG